MTRSTGSGQAVERNIFMTTEREREETVQPDKNTLNKNSYRYV